MSTLSEGIDLAEEFNTWAAGMIASFIDEDSALNDDCREVSQGTRQPSGIQGRLNLISARGLDSAWSAACSHMGMRILYFSAGRPRGWWRGKQANDVPLLHFSLAHQAPQGNGGPLIHAGSGSQWNLLQSKGTTVAYRQASGTQSPRSCARTECPMIDQSVRNR